MIKDGKLICPEVRIENTSRCNSACIMCPREQMTRPKTTMPMAHFRSLVDQSVALGAETISVFGYGEPFLDKKIADKIAYCTDLGMSTFITTNGSLVDTQAATRVVDAGLKNIRFSVHAVKAKDYNAVHKGLEADVTFRNIYNFMAISRGRCKVHISSISLNGNSLGAIKARWGAFDYLEVWKPHNWAYGRQYRQVKPEKRTCGRPFSGPVQINADGKMMLCCFDFDARMTIGDTYTQSIKSIIETSLELKRIQACHEAGDHKGLPCLTCDQLNNENESPLLYSNRDISMAVNKTSTIKFNLGGNKQ